MRTVCVILGGWRGTRLRPLTTRRAKPAVPLAGKYRLIDIPISNCINSGLQNIFILTQFMSASLNGHIARTYRFDMFARGFVEVIAAEQTDADGEWFQGTADAVRQHLHRFAREGVENVLILGGDHLYRMKYEEMIAQHDESGADITVATYPVTREECEGFGVLATDSEGTIRAFREKPASDEDISDLELPGAMKERWGTDKGFLASMGIYVFRVSALQAYLADSSLIDFGRDILPKAIHSHKVSAHVFGGYWEDIGTIRAFYEANLMLTEEDSPFRFYVPEAPIFTRPRFLPPSVLREGHVERSLIAEGSLVLGARVVRSIIGLRSWLQPGCRVEDAIIMGADFYEVHEKRQEVVDRGGIPLGIGEGASICRAIIDKNARIGAGAVIHGAPDRPDEDHGDWVVRDGIVIVAKGATVPPGAVL
mgnify:FL=1